MTQEPIEIRTPFVLDFSGNNPKAGDFRAKVETVVKTEEQEVDEVLAPKGSSALELAPSSNSGQLTLDLQGTTASAEKDSGQPKASEPGRPTLSPAISAGKPELPVQV